MHPALHRYAEPPPFPTARYVAAGALCGFAGIVLTLAVAQLLEVRSHNAYQASLEDRASPPRLASTLDLSASATDDWSLRAFPAWVVAHPTESCPAHLADLAPYAPHTPLVDPFGTPYRFTCDGRHFHVLSAGPDRVFGSDDDAGSGE